MRSIFGTDGIRGLANSFPITAEVALKIGIAIGVYIKTDSSKNKKVIIAKDTRLSSDMIEYALASGLISTGISAILVGVMPTPSIPILIKSLQADFGVIVTASHNPYHDNGMKLFNNDGLKINARLQKKIENIIFKDSLESDLCSPLNLGRIKKLSSAQNKYIRHIKKSFSRDIPFSNLKVVLDCANGSSYKLAPCILNQLGIKVIKIHCKPNGLNINDKCGSVHTDTLCQTVIKTQADIGIGLDGDSDRIVACDEYGKLIPGEYIIAIIAHYLKTKNKLKGGAVVVTKITNRALEKYLKTIGINTLYSDIGDSKVSELMLKNGINFGGEESGHMIFSDYSYVGDGILSSLQILRIMAEENLKISDIPHLFKMNPAIKSNIVYYHSNPLENVKVMRDINNEMNNYNSLNIVVRKSGTEKYVRVFVEGRDKELIRKAHDRIVKIIKS